MQVHENNKIDIVHRVIFYRAPPGHSFCRDGRAGPLACYRPAWRTPLGTSARNRLRSARPPPCTLSSILSGASMARGTEENEYGLNSAKAPQYDQSRKCQQGRFAIPASPSCSFSASWNDGPVGSDWKFGSGSRDPLSWGVHSMEKSNVPVSAVRSSTGRPKFPIPVNEFAISAMVRFRAPNRRWPGALAGIWTRLPQTVGNFAEGPAGGGGAAAPEVGRGAGASEHDASSICGLSCGPGFPGFNNEREHRNLPVLVVHREPEPFCK